MVKLGIHIYIRSVKQLAFKTHAITLDRFILFVKKKKCSAALECQALIKLKPTVELKIAFCSSLECFLTNQKERTSVFDLG